MAVASQGRLAVRHRWPFSFLGASADPPRELCPDVRELGACPAAQSGVVDITSLYVAKFGAPGVGKKIFVQAYQTKNGWEDQPVQFSGIVPAST